MTVIVIMHGRVVGYLHIDKNTPCSVCEQVFHAGGNFGVSGDQILGLRGENCQNDDVLALKLM